MSCLLTFKFRLKKIGTGCYIGYSTYIKSNCVSIGSNTFIGNKCHISCPLSIGNDVLLASKVSVVGGDHAFDKPGLLIREGDLHQQESVIIEDDVWVGHGVIILHGVRIGAGAIVAAGAVVTNNVNPLTIVAGVPAKEIRRRFSSIAEEKLHLEFLKQEA